jgi:hypothetical protein
MKRLETFMTLNHATVAWFFIYLLHFKKKAMLNSNVDL